MGTIDIHTLDSDSGLFLSCHVLADANDIAECLLGSGHPFKKVGYKGIWLADRQALNYLAMELPGLKQALARAEAPGSGD